MNSILVKIIDKLVIQSRTNPRGRRPAATTEHYLKQIMSVLRSGGVPDPTMASLKKWFTLYDIS